MLLLVAGVAVTRAEPEVQAAISCQECIDEMHKLAYIIKGSAADIEVEEDMIHSVLISNTCPGVPEGRLLPHAGGRGAGLLRGAPRQQLRGHIYNIYTISISTQYLQYLPYLCVQVAMLFMIINHFFVDGAQHICLAWGVCHPRQDLSYITCEECVEGMEWVQAYMTDPLWVAEYTLYLEQVGASRIMTCIK